MSSTPYRGISYRLLNGRHQVRWRETKGGVPSEVSKSFATRDEADLFIAEQARRRGLMEVGLSFMADRMKSPGKLDVLIPEYVHHLNEICKPGSPYAKDSQDRLRRMQRVFGWSTTSDITEHAIRLVLIKWTKAKRSGYMNATLVQRFLRWAKPRYDIRDDAIQLVIKNPPMRERELWSDKDIRRICAYLLRPLDPELAKTQRKGTIGFSQKVREIILRQMHQAFYPIFRLQVLWALRPIEAARLYVRDWHGPTRQVTITPDNAKNGRLRRFPVDIDTARWMDRLAGDRPGDARLFLSGDRNTYAPWTTRSLTRCMRHILKTLDIKGSLYCARHYATTRLLRDLKGEWRTVMAITGHTTASAFFRYVHMLDDSLERVASSDYASRLLDSGMTDPTPMPPSAMPTLSTTTIAFPDLAGQLPSDDGVQYDQTIASDNDIREEPDEDEVHLCDASESTDRERPDDEDNPPSVLVNAQ